MQFYGITSFKLSLYGVFKQLQTREKGKKSKSSIKTFCKISTQLYRTANNSKNISSIGNLYFSSRSQLNLLLFPIGFALISIIT